MKVGIVTRLVLVCACPGVLVALACSGPRSAPFDDQTRGTARAALASTLGEGSGVSPGDIPLGLAGETPSGTVSVLASGTDTPLCMSWEPTIAVDPNNPRILAVAQFVTIQVSFNGGATFPAIVSAPGVSLGGDPSIAFDSQGRLFITYLCSPGTGRDVCISGYACNAGTSSCALLPGAWPVNVAAAAGIGDNNADKEWLAADANGASPFADRLYVVWSRLDTSPWSMWASFSADAGQTWSPAAQISANDEGNTWPSHVAVGPTGSVYAAWHSQTGYLDAAGNDVPDGVTGQVVLRRSDDGGANWQPRSFPYGPGDSDMTFNVQHEANGLIPGANMWLQGSLQPWILPDPLDPNRVHVIANDDPDNDVDNGDAADVFLVTSNDQGAAWGARVQVDQGPAGTFQVMPTAAINPINGAIGVAYFDNRAGADADGDGVFELDLLATFSTDGGLTWSAETDINDDRIDPARATTCRFCGSDAVSNQTCGTPACPAPGTTRIGEYFGIAYGECTLHFAWPDDAVPVCGGDYDTFYDRDPALGGDLTAPVIACPADQEVECTAPTDPGATGAATATDTCDLNPVITFVDVILPGNCPVGNVVETIQRTWRATDAAGNIAFCQQTITIVDTTPPVVACSVDVPALWPPNHGLVDVGFTFSAADDCDPAPPDVAVTVTSDEATATPVGAGGPIHCPDAVVETDGSVLLRAERSGPQDGRVYQLTVTATDACGNATPCSAVVTVPTNPGPTGVALDSGQSFDATTCN